MAAEQTALTEIGAVPEPKPDSAVIRDALGVGVAVGLSGFAFGVTSAGSGLSMLQTCVLSLLVFTGASQFALVGALAAGGSPFTAAAGAFFLGVRNTFYGLRLSQLLALPRAVRPFAAHWVIDETTAVTLIQPTRRAARIGFTATGLTLYVLWNITTLLGALGAEALGDTDAWGLDAAGPAVFLALLAPMLRTTTERAVAGLAVVLGLGLLPLLPGGVPVLVAALSAPLVLFLKGRAGRGAARNSTVGDPVAENPVAENPVAEGPVAGSPAAQSRATDNPATERAVTENRTAENRTAENRTAENRTAENRTAEKEDR